MNSFLSSRMPPGRIGKFEILFLLCIFLLAFAVRLDYIGGSMGDLDMVSANYDAVDYHWLAQNIIRGRGYETFDSTGHKSILLRPPLYPLFLAALYLTFGEGFVSPCLADITFSCLTIIVLYLLARKLYGVFPAMIASLIMIFFARSIHLATHFYSDNLFCFLFVLFLYFLLAREETAANYAWAGIFSGLMVLTRSIWLPVVFFIFLWMVLVCRRRILRAALASAVSLLVLLPWIYYCTAVQRLPFSPALLSSTVGAVNLWGATNPELGDFAHLGASGDREFEQEWKEVILKRYRHYELEETAYIQLLGEESRRFFMDQPWRCLRLAVTRLKRKWLASGLFDGQETLVPLTGKDRVGVLYWHERILDPGVYVGTREVIDAVWWDTGIHVFGRTLPLLSFEAVAYSVFWGFWAGLLLYGRNYFRKFGGFLKRSSLLLGTIVGYGLTNLIGISADRYRYPLDLILVMWAGIAVYLILMLPGKIVAWLKPHDAGRRR